MNKAKILSVLLCNLSLVTLSISLTGCYEDRKEVTLHNGWKPKIERLSWHDEIHFKKGSSSIKNSEKRKIKSLVQKTEPKLPLYARIQVAKHFSEGRVSNLKHVLMGYGITSDKIDVTYLNTSSSQGEKIEKSGCSAIVVIDQYRLTLPQCPSWGEITTNSGRNGDEPFGCATAYNFGKMIADPRDLYKGKTSDGVDSAYQALAIERYRTDKIKALKSERVQSSAGQ
ncbi:CpaD family pilus assembly protein [Candidatus Nucleicultrix amoebiphila]|jgi:pilus biogenesis lipoprotein CpaD|uniref:CpaD family pilus assembly protein n=1 Tax=Candidatus Nucleicultrix amoebiphila TaxID=1509244 RepID=UPI000A26FF61|nr:CpaD family pilus assembly lipoprotein [Candidatus Nucleicultrix amoebiphila]